MTTTRYSLKELQDMTMKRGTFGRFSWICDATTQVFVLGKSFTLVRDRGQIVLITFGQRILHRAGVMATTAVTEVRA